MVGAVSGRAWALYALMAVLWGIPYLFIKRGRRLVLARGDRTMLSPARAIGLAVGFAGVVVIVAGPGLAVADPAAALTAIGEVLLVALL